MNYIILVAGRGTRLNPLTYNYPKSLFKLDDDMPVLKHMTESIKSTDPKANVVIVTGFLSDNISKDIKYATFVYNPFYAVTNSIASLWFAREYLEGDCVIINGDVVVSKKLMKEVISKPVKGAAVLLDSSIKKDGDYNAQVYNGKVIAMSKGLKEYFGEYGGITLIDGAAAKILKNEIELMVHDGYYTQFYEDALVQMIFRYDFELGYVDISNYEWTEIDEVDDLIKAKIIYHKDNYRSK